MTLDSKYAAAGGLFRFHVRDLTCFKIFAGIGLILILIAMGLLTSSCSRKSQTETKSSVQTDINQNAQTPSAQNEAENSRVPWSPSAVPSNATPEQAIQQLNMELRLYISHTHTVPKSFEEFIAHDPIKFPPPSPGKKYVLTSGGLIVFQ